MLNKFKDFLSIGQLEKLFSIKLRNAVLGVLIVNCVISLLLECTESWIHMNHIQLNGFMNTTYEISLLLNGGCEYIRIIILDTLPYSKILFQVLLLKMCQNWWAPCSLCVSHPFCVSMESSRKEQILCNHGCGSIQWD